MYRLIKFFIKIFDRISFVKSIYVVMLMKVIIIEIVYCFILLEFRLDFFIVVKLGEKI